MIVNITTYSEADFVRDFAYRTSDDTPIDMSGYDMRMMIRKKPSAASALIESSMANGMITIKDHVNGLFQVRISYAELSVLAEGEYVQSLVAKISATAAGESTIYKQIWHGSMMHFAGATRWPTNPGALIVPLPDAGPPLTVTASPSA